MKYPKKVVLTEVGPRDGLQNESVLIKTADKIAFIEELVNAGCSQIEVTSFVKPDAVPQMSDAAEVMAQLQKRSQARYIVLTPNQIGFERAMECKAKAIAVFTATSDKFNLKNTNATVDESLQKIQRVTKGAIEKNIWVRAYISTSFHCPYDGSMSPEKVLKVARSLLDMGVDELSIGDTIGKATPNQVEELLNLLLKHCSEDKIALHFHDTRGTALANILMGLQMGIYKYDSSAGGLGGCPYAPGASGNVATEDLLYMLHGMGIETGIDLDKVASASLKLSKILGRPLSSRYLQTLSSSC